tara:strand:+ start:1283 stop:1621 length:339 start_codon:yes stop_codon:yes gene_type:complete
MNSQIFRENLPKDILFDFLKENSSEKINYYFFTKTHFKAAQFQKLVAPFLEKIKPYYFSSKQKYVTRKMNYKNFVTIVRQICKFHHIPFSSNIKYDKSTYEINYNIYFSSEQ